MKICALALSAALGASGAAWAQCADVPPIRFAETVGDTTIDADWMNSMLVGRTVNYEDSSEEYRRDGTYVFRAGRSVSHAPEYRFYADGTRCIGYDGAPRYDRYVLSGDVLTLINAQGTRFPAWVSN